MTMRKVFLLVSLAGLLSAAAAPVTNITPVATFATKAYVAESISTNNPAFVSAVTNCPVVIAASDGITLGDFGQYGTIGALLAAIAAAITWLRGNKMDATSAAPAYQVSGTTYSAGEYVTHDGILYECTSATPVSGEWDASKWTATDMTKPDATLDIMGDGRLSVVSAEGDILWMEGYRLSSNSSATISASGVNIFTFPATTATEFSESTAYNADDRVIYDGTIYKFNTAHAAGAWIGTDADEDPDIQSFTLPAVPDGIVGDLILDIDNSANPNASVAASLTGAMTSYDVYTVKGKNISDILTFAGGETCELYFTMTAFGSGGKPAWKVVKQVVEKQEAGS